jgi:hypothetical protein
METSKCRFDTEKIFQISKSNDYEKQIEEFFEQKREKAKRKNNWFV